MKHRKILVIDDDEEILTLARELLERDGYDVVIHRSGFGASSAVRANQPDLVLLDINMPALSGEKLASIIQANVHTAQVPIVFFSSDEEENLRSRAARSGVRGYICKTDLGSLGRRAATYLTPPVN